MKPSKSEQLAGLFRYPQSYLVNREYSQKERMLRVLVEKYQMDMVSVLRPESNNYPADKGSNRLLF